MRTCQILLSCPLTATAAPAWEVLVAVGEDTRGHRRRFARRFFDRYQSPEPSPLLELEPGLEGMPMPGQHFGACHPGAGVAAGQERERLPPRALFRSGLGSQRGV